MSKYFQDRPELLPPTYDDFEMIKEALLQVAAEPDAVVRPGLGEGNSLFIHVERIYADLDYCVWPPLTISLSGLLRTVQDGSKMVVRYRELPHNNLTENSSVNHDYVFRTEDGELVKFGQSILGCPSLREQQQLCYRDNDDLRDQADAGKKILQQQLGNGLEPSAGDCGVLFDRMAQFLE